MGWPACLDLKIKKVHLRVPGAGSHAWVNFFICPYFWKTKVSDISLIMGDDLLPTSLESHLKGDQKINFFFFAWKPIFQHIHLKTPQNKKKTILSIKKQPKTQNQTSENLFFTMIYCFRPYESPKTP
jgi:hypothetical protein